MPDVKREEPENAARYFERSETWRNRFMLSLTIGNAAGLAALASAGLGADATPGLLRPLLPWMWAFSFGLAAGGLVPLCAWREARWYYLMSRARAAPAKDRSISTENVKIAERRERIGRRWGFARRVSTVASGMFFVGLFGALATVTLIVSL